MIINLFSKRPALILTLILLTGCGGGSGSSSDKSKEDPGGDTVRVPVSVDLPPDITIYNGEVLNLTSSVSGGGELTYQWQQLSGRTVSFTDSDALTTCVIYTPGMETETLEFRLTARNDFSSDSDTVTVTIVDRIHEAAKIGDPALLPENVSELEQRIQDRVALAEGELAALHSEIFGEDAIIFDPGKHSRFFFLNSLTSAKEVINGNKGHTFVTATDADGQRTVAVGTNVIVELDNGYHMAFAPHMVKLIDWLLAPHGLDTAGGDEVRVALMLMGGGNMDSTERWLRGEYTGVTVKRCSDEAQLSACLADAHLIVTGTSDTMAETSVTAALEQAASNRQSLLYTHNNYWNSTALTNPILTYFGVQTQAPGSPGNFFSEDAANWRSAEEMRSGASVLADISGIASRFQHNNFSFAVSDCDDNDGDCGNLPAFASEFLDIAETLQGIVRGFDESAKDIFSAEGEYAIERLLILLGDKYRQSVTFPMSKATTDTLAYLRSYFADHLVYSSRRYNPVPEDLGNFSRTDFSHVTPTSKRVEITSRKWFRAAGVYALPGRTVSVTRTDDNSAKAATIFINTQRPGSTQHMDPNNGYNRPKFLRSHQVPISAGETIELTSPYGGPVQIGFEDTGTEMTFEFSNIGLHPYWKPGDDNAGFSAALASNHYDWAEMATEHFEIHSSASKMQETLSGRWSTPSGIEYFITKYHHNYHKVLSGYRGENIDIVDEIHDFAATNGYEIPVYDSVQHINADQPTCGYGCSGNPYDAGWAFSVLGHGDLHEVGHNFESGRFKFNGFEGHSTTNFYSYYVKSRARDEDGVDHSCQALPFDGIAADLQTAQGKPDPAAYMASLGYSQWNYGVALVIEMMMHAEEKGALNNGWHLIPRLHLLERAYETADDNDADWEAARASLGFSSYTRSEARSIDNNDWLLIAASYSTGLDYRPFLDLLGLSYSAKAAAQVASFAYPEVERAFYVPASNSGYCDTLTGHEKQSF